MTFVVEGRHFGDLYYARAFASHVAADQDRPIKILRREHGRYRKTYDIVIPRPENRKLDS